MGGGPSFSFGSRVEVFDGTTWTEGPSLNQRRLYACAVSVNASGNSGQPELVVLGGHAGGRAESALDSVETLTAGASAWDNLTTPKLNQARKYPMCAGWSL